MKFTVYDNINHYNVEIKVTDEDGKKATKRVLCALNCMLAQARAKYHDKGYTALAKGVSAVEDSI